MSNIFTYFTVSLPFSSRDIFNADSISHFDCEILLNFVFCSAELVFLYKLYLHLTNTLSLLFSVMILHMDGSKSGI